MAGCISERRSKSGLLIGCFAGAVLCLGAQGSKVTAVRFWSLGEVTRVAIEVTSDFHYKSDRLTSPDRLFFDIEGAKPEMISKGMHVIAVGDGLLKQIRIAETQPGVTRVVLDLEQRAEFTASQLADPNRLMIELKLKDRPAPPPTGSVSGARVITESPARAVEEDLVAPPLAAALPPMAARHEPAGPVMTEVVKPQAAKPEPRRFAPPPMQAAAPRDSAPTLLAQPPVWLGSQAAKFASPAPSTALARNLAPPPDVPKPLPPYTPVDAAPASTPVTAPKVTASIPPSSTPPISALPPARPEPTPLPAKRNTTGDRSLTRVLGLKLGRVVLDPGHGGHDAGTHGSSGLVEKDVVLDVAQRLGALIESRLGSEVIYTRTDDTFIPLEERTQIANDRKADLFLSIHANSSPYRTVAGVEAYYLNFTTSRTALDVATRENASSQRSVFDLREVLQKIALKDKIDESREFAARVDASLYGLSSKSNPGAKNRGVKKAPFVVLIGASMPSVLAEIGFLTNAGDEALLKKPEHRQKIAEALYKGVANYADTLSHFQVAKRE